MNKHNRRQESSKVVKPIRLTSATLLKAAQTLAGNDPKLADVLASHGPPPLLRRPATFATLVHIILEQQVSVESAKSTFDRLRDSLDGEIVPETVLEHGEDGLKELGFSRQKSRYTIALATDCQEKRFRIDRLRQKSDQQVRDEICARLGLGNWSAEVFMMMALLRPDVLPVGDLALVKGMAELDSVEYADSDAVLQRAEKWRPFRSVATRMVWQHYAASRRRKIF